MNKSGLLLLLLSLLTLPACKTREKALETGKEAGEHLLRKERERSEFLTQAEAANPDFDWLAARGRVSIRSGGRSHQASLHLRMQKGQVIWASVTALLGLEVARAKITPDSIQLYNRLERTYLSEDFDYLRKNMYPGLSFELLEAALTGGAPPDLMEESGAIWRGPQGYRLEGLEDLFSYAIRFSPQYKPSEIFVKEREGEDNFKLNYGNFGSVSGKTLPQSLEFLGQAEEKELRIQIMYESFTFGEATGFPFRIPGNYDRMR